MGIFANVNNATPPSGGGAYLTAGVYPKLEIEAIKVVNSRKKQIFFCVELRVHESSGEKANKPGTRCSWMVDIAQDAGPGNIKEFAAQLYGQDFNSITEEDIDALVAKEQPASGRFVAAEAIDIKTRQNKDFTKVTWANIPDDQQPENHRTGASA